MSRRLRVCRATFKHKFGLTFTPLITFVGCYRAGQEGVSRSENFDRDGFIFRFEREARADKNGAMIPIAFY